VTGHQLLNTWARFGAAHFVRKSGKRHWAIDDVLGRVNKVFATKHEAIALAESMISAELTRCREAGAL